MSRVSMQPLTRALIVAVVTLVPLAKLPAQQAADPAVVVSIASVDSLLENIGYLTRAAGTPEVGGLVTLMAGQYVQGLDAERPAGVLVNLSGPQPSGVAYLPVEDMSMVMRKIEEQLGEPENVGGGVRKIALQRDIFFRERDGWILVSDSVASLNQAPRDPARAFGDLPTKYEVAVRVHVQGIPAPLREMAISEMRTGFDRGLSDALSEEDRDFQEQFGRRGVENLVSFVQDADQVTIGWGVDDQNGMTYLDVAVTANQGTKLERRFARNRNGKTDFAGFLKPGPVAQLHFTSQASEEEIEQAQEMLGFLRKKLYKEIDGDDDLSGPAARDQAKEIVGSFVDILEDTVKTGKFDGGAALYLNNDTLQFIAGGGISDGGELEQVVRKLVDLAKKMDDDPNLNRIRFDAQNYAGVDFHTLDLPIPANEEEARKVLGETLPLALGTGPEAIYFAAGQGSIEMLKKLIDQSAAERSTAAEQLTFDLALGDVLRFAGSLEDEPAVRQMAESLEPGKDHISLTAKGLPRGVVYRLSIQEGVLKLIGVAARNQGAQGN